MKNFFSNLLILFLSLSSKAQTAYSYLAQQSAMEGNYEEAIRLEEEALKLIEYIYGKSHPEYASSLNNLAVYNFELWNSQEALRLGTEAMKIREEVHGKLHPDYATSLNNLALFNSDLGNYQEAVRLGTEALRIIEEVYGKNHPVYAMTIGNLSVFYSDLGNYQEAVRLGTEALRIIEEVHGKNHPSYATTLSDVSDLYSDLGNYQEAFRLGTEALNIREKVLGKNHPDYASSLHSLAWYNYNLGNHQVAIRCGTEALNIFEEVFGKNHPAFAMTIGDLAVFYSNLGNYQEAVRLGTEALRIIEEVHGKNHPLYATGLHNLADYNSDLGNYQEAFRLGMEALDIREKVLGKNHPDYASSLGNLASFNAFLGNYQEAIRLGTESLNIFEEIFGRNHPDYARYLNSLAGYNYGLGNYQEAIRCGTEALKIRKEVLDKNHPDYAKSLISLSFYFALINDIPNLKKTAWEVSYLRTKGLKSNFISLPLSERNHFWSTIEFWYTLLLPKYAHDKLQREFVALGFDALLLSKGIILNSEMEFDKFLAESGDEALLAKYNEIKSLRLQLNKLYEKPIAERYVDMDSLERRANELERQLMQESAEFGDYTRNLSITWEDVRNNLKEKDAAIEFVHFPLNNDSTMYMAYVLRPNMEAPGLVKLFEEKDLTNLIDKDDKTRIYTNKLASGLIWGKLQPQLEGVENVYFAPDGILHQIAIEYFPDVDGEGMIADRFNLHRVSSTREIALNRHNAPTKEAVVYGGIKYDTDVATMETESRKYERPKHRGFSPYYNLGDSLALRGSLEYLGGSLIEAKNINGMMKESNYTSIFFTGNEATEESFKSLSGKANGIIHISTHGFYWTESEAERKASLNDRLMFMSQFGDNARRNVEDKALTRTGLFMAGAKNALGGVELPEDVDDGILTAQEIANLDLRGLDLVVLSACQTGMGDISGDGVFGLQRGFKKAGANTILMSLWDVSDEATQILMTNFYKNYLGGMSKQQALCEAQKAVRATPGFSDPEYWAAFILLDALN